MPSQRENTDGSRNDGSEAPRPRGSRSRRSGSSGELNTIPTGASSTRRTEPAPVVPDSAKSGIWGILTG